MPLYVLGFMGMTRRINHYDNPAWHPWLIARRMRRGADRDRHRAPGGADHRQRARPQSAAISRRHGRSVGRPHAGMGDVSSPPPVVQLRDHSRRCTNSTRSPHMKESAQGLGTQAGLSRHSHAVEYVRRVDRRNVQPGARFRRRLAHLVAGHRRPGRIAVGTVIVLQLPARTKAITSRPPRSRRLKRNAPALRLLQVALKWID